MTESTEKFIEDGIWKIYGGLSAYADIVDAQLIVEPVLSMKGWGWCVWPYPQRLDNLIPYTDVVSEMMCYPTLEAAMYACENFYVREFHGEPT